MTLENKRKQLIFRSSHRGTKEMDIILGSFASKYVSHMSEEELTRYESFLTLPDPQLYNWFTRTEPVPANIHDDLVDQFLNHKVPISS